MDLTGHWDGMPEFIRDETRPKHTIKVWLTKQKPAKGKDRGFTTVHFQTKNKELLEEFGKKIGSKLTFGIKELTRDTDERGLAKILYGNGHVIRHHSTFFPWKDEIAHRKFWTQACEVYYEKAPKGMRIVRRPLNPEYPVYIISKSRWETPLTARALEKSKTPYFMVVEPKEFFEYHKTFKDKKFKYGTILIAPENFSERGQGSI